MAGNRTVKIEILGDARGIRQAFGDAGSAAGGLISKLGSVATVAGGFVVGQALTALPGLLSGASDMAIQLEQNARKASTVFGDSLGVVQSWASDAAAGMGLTNNEAVALAASMGDLLVPLGFSREAAANMSTEMLNLSGALAEWSGGQKSAAEVSDILTAAMLGEYDQLKSLGISIDANEVKQRAATLTGAEFANMTDQQKEAIAAQQLILEKSTDAQNAYATSQDDLASRQARLTAQWKTAKEQLASALIPAIQAVLGAVLPLATTLFTQLGPAIEQVSAFVGRLVAAFQSGGLSGALDLIVQQVSAFAPVLLAQLQSWGSAFLGWIQPLIPPLLEKLAQLAVQIGDWIVNTGVPWLAAKLAGWADAFGAWASAAVPPMLERLSELLAQLGTWVSDVALPALFEKLGQWGQAFVDWIGPRIVPMLEALWQLYYAIESWMLTEALPAIAEKLLEWGAQFVAWIAPQIGPMLEQLGNLLAQLGSWLIDTALPEIGARLLEWGAAFVAWVAPQIGPLLSELGGLLLALGGWLIGTALPEIGAKLLEWGLAFVKWVAPQIPPLLAELGGLLIALGDWILTTALPEITTKLLEWATAFLEWIANDVLPELPGKLAEIISTIAGWVTDNLGTLASEGARIGLEILSGIASGIYDNAASIVGAAIDFVTGLLPGWVKKGLGIESPSKVMIPIGMEVTAGIAKGIVDAIPLVQDALGQVAQAIGSAPMPLPGMGQIGSAPMPLPGGPGAIGSGPMPLPGTTPPGQIPGVGLPPGATPPGQGIGTPWAVDYVQQAQDFFNALHHTFGGGPSLSGAPGGYGNAAGMDALFKGIEQAIERAMFRALTGAL